MLNWITARDRILVSIPRTPYTAPCDTEIAGVTGGTLPNGVLTDRVENQIKKAGTTFELGRQGVHSLQQQGQDQSDECPTFQDMARDLDWPHLIICAISSASPVSNTWAKDKQWERSPDNTTPDHRKFTGLKKCAWQQLLVDYASLPGRQENNCFMVTQNGINVSWMSVRKSLKNPVKYHSKWYSQSC